MIDAMKIRKRGTPQDPLLMSAVMISVRIGTAAFFAGKDADNMLGRLGHLLKYFFEITHIKNVVLRLVLKGKNSKRLIGIGGQYIVLRAEDPAYIEKYSHTLAGADPAILQWMLKYCVEKHKKMQSYFGDLIQTAKYDLATLPVRGPAKRLLTLRARQPLLTSYVDLFSTEAQNLVRLPGSTALRRDMRELHKRILKAIKDNVWLDIIGPENVVVTLNGNEPRISIIDIEPYVPEYLPINNPIAGKTYKDIFMERLKAIEQLCVDSPRDV